MTSEWRRQEWVSIAVSWGSKSGDQLWRLGWRLGGRKTDGDAAGYSGNGDDADSGKDPTRVDLRMMAFETG